MIAVHKWVSRKLASACLTRAKARLGLGTGVGLRIYNCGFLGLETHTCIALLVSPRYPLLLVTQNFPTWMSAYQRLHRMLHHIVAMARAEQQAKKRHP